MSTAEGWDFTLPRDASELEALLAEARRHGVEPGAHLRVVPAVEPEQSAGEQPTTTKKRRTVTYAGMGETNLQLSEDTDRHLQGFGQ
jgi:hypothetical protein